MMGFSFVLRRQAPGFRSLAAGVCALLIFALAVGEAQGAAALLLEMPYGQMGAFNPTGHAALYFDHICVATPLTLRPCEPGELGVVISRYDGIGEFDWVAMPLIPYLYGVQRASEIPVAVDRLTALRMRDLYRREHLQEVAPDTAEGGMPEGNWYELVGSAFDRTIYGFQLKTTEEQDAQLIAYFNDRPNVTRYQGAVRNCADFTRVVLNHLYPGAVRRNYIADFGVSTPKSVARGVVHYGRKHPELGFTMFRVPQLEGSIPRSMSVQGVAGSLLTRYGVPMAILSPHVTAVVLVAYVGKGRFAVPKNAPVLDVAALESAADPRNGSLLLAATGASPTPAVTDMDPFADTPGTGEELQPASGSGFVPATFLTSPACDLCDTLPFLP